MKDLLRVRRGLEHQRWRPHFSFVFCPETQKEPHDKGTENCMLMIVPHRGSLPESRKGATVYRMTNWFISTEAQARKNNVTDISPGEMNGDIISTDSAACFFCFFFLVNGTACEMRKGTGPSNQEPGWRVPGLFLL